MRMHSLTLPLITHCIVYQCMTPPESAPIVSDGRDRLWKHTGVPPASEFRPLELYPWFIYHQQLELYLMIPL